MNLVFELEEQGFLGKQKKIGLDVSKVKFSVYRVVVVREVFVFNIGSCVVLFSATIFVFKRA